MSFFLLFWYNLASLKWATDTSTDPHLQFFIWLHEHSLYESNIFIQQSVPALEFDHQSSVSRVWIHSPTKLGFFTVCITVRLWLEVAG